MTVTRTKLPAADPYMGQLDLLPAELSMEHVPKLSFLPYTGAHIDEATGALVLVGDKIDPIIPGKRFVWDIVLRVDVQANATVVATLRAAGNACTQRGELVAAKSVRASVDPHVAADAIKRTITRAELGALTVRADVLAALRDAIEPEPPAPKVDWRRGVPAAVWSGTSARSTP